MKIQYNTDKTVSGSERYEEYFTGQINEQLDRFKTHLSRIEVHLSDENGNKEGRNDILCALEARMEGKQPIAVSNKADTIELAVSGAIKKLKTSLDSILGQLRDY